MKQKKGWGVLHALAQSGLCSLNLLQLFPLLGEISKGKSWELPWLLVWQLHLRVGIVCLLRALELLVVTESASLETTPCF